MTSFLNELKMATVFSVSASPQLELTYLQGKLGNYYGFVSKEDDLNGYQAWQLTSSH